jgi:large subunit ribosomal protein L30
MSTKKRASKPRTAKKTATKATQKRSTTTRAKKPEKKGPIESVEVKKPVVEVKPVEVKKPVVEVKPVEVKKPVVEVKPVEVKKPVVEVKPVEVKKPVVKAKPAKIKKPIPAKRDEPFLLVIRLRGTVAVPARMQDALRILRLERRYSATLVKSSPSVTGMLRRVKDYVTWGGVGAKEIAELLKERGEVIGGVPLTDKFVKENFSKESVDALVLAITQGQLDLRSLWEKGIRPTFRLRPPSGGFELTIKRPVGGRGELGYRGPAIATLLTSMA